MTQARPRNPSYEAVREAVLGSVATAVESRGLVLVLGWRVVLV
jgi:hypothetical protein